MADQQAQELRAEVERLRRLLNNGWLVVNDPANSFLAAEPWSDEVERELGQIKGCMRAARRRPARPSVQIERPDEGPRFDSELLRQSAAIHCLNDGYVEGDIQGLLKVMAVTEAALRGAREEAERKGLNDPARTDKGRLEDAPERTKRIT